MKGHKFTILFIVICSFAFGFAVWADYKFNPFTSKLDYYETASTTPENDSRYVNVSSDIMIGDLGIKADLDVYTVGDYLVNDNAYTYNGNNYDFQAIVGAYWGIYYATGSDLAFGGYFGDPPVYVLPDIVDGSEDIGVMLGTVYQDVGFGAPFRFTFYYLLSEYADLYNFLAGMFGAESGSTWTMDYKNDGLFTNNGAGNDFTYNADANLIPYPSGTPSIAKPLISTFNVDDATGNITTSGQYTSSLANGTAPFDLSSATLNTNLNADYLDGLHAGNSSGYIPISNGTVNTNLNADLWDGYQSSDYLDQAVKQASSPSFGGLTLNGNLLINTTNAVQFRDANNYIQSSATDSIDFVVDTGGQYRFSSGAGSDGGQLVIGNSSSFNSNYGKLNINDNGPVPENTGTFYHVLSSMEYQASGWTGDSASNRQASALQVAYRHYTPYMINYPIGGNFVLQVNSGRDWETPGTPTVGTRGAALQFQVYNQDDYAHAIYGFYQEQGSCQAITRNTKIGQYFGGSFGRLQIQGTATYTSHVDLATGLDIWPVTVQTNGSLDQYRGITVGLPSMDSDAGDNIDFITGIKFNHGTNSSATYTMTNYYGVEMSGISSFTGGSNYGFNFYNWDNQNDTKVISIDDIDGVSSAIGLYINDISIGGDNNNANAWGIYTGSTAKNYFGATTTINAILHLTPRSQPGSATEGDVYSDTDDHHLYFYNGSGWVQLDN